MISGKEITETSEQLLESNTNLPPLSTVESGSRLRTPSKKRTSGGCSAKQNLMRLSSFSSQLLLLVIWLFCHTRSSVQAFSAFSQRRVQFDGGETRGHNARNPVEEETGWQLVAHVGASSNALFGGDGDLQANYTYGPYTWYPTAYAPDFEVKFPVVAEEIMFISGDGAVWAITDYQSLRLLIDAREGNSEPNLDFIVCREDGTVHNLVGNVLSRSGKVEDPIITVPYLNDDEKDGSEIGDVDKVEVSSGDAKRLILWAEAGWETEDESLMLLKRLHGGVNVFVRDQAYRNPLREPGWHLVAHMSSRGGMFAGLGNLGSSYAFGTPNWYPTESTPDFQIHFPVEAQEIMFVTGDGTIWAVADYPTLRDVIDRRDAVTNPNIGFLLSENGRVRWTRGNVLSREGVNPDPIITMDGSYVDGLRNGNIIWAESSWGSTRVQLLHKNHAGINVFVREALKQSSSYQLDDPWEDVAPGPSPSPSPIEEDRPTAFRPLTPRTHNGTEVAYPNSPAPSPSSQGRDSSFPDDDFVNDIYDDDDTPNLDEDFTDASVSPTSAKVSQPTAAPALNGSMAPSMSPAPMSSMPLQIFSMENASMAFVNVNELETEDMISWRDVTTRYLLDTIDWTDIEDVFDFGVVLLTTDDLPQETGWEWDSADEEESAKGEEKPQEKVSQSEATSESLGVPPNRRALSTLPPVSDIEFIVEVRYRSSTSTDHRDQLYDYVKQALTRLAMNEKYLVDLRNSDSVAFSRVAKVRVSLMGESLGGGRIDFKPRWARARGWILIGGSLFSVLVASVFTGYILYRFRYLSHLDGVGGATVAKGGKTVGRLDRVASLSPFRHPGRVKSFIEMDPQEDISTLGDPEYPMYNDQSTVGKEGTVRSGSVAEATVDYDYTRTYGNASVSTVGGTKGDETTRAGGGSTLQGSMMHDLDTIFTDDESFEAHYGERGGGNAHLSVREEVIDIFVPPGKLGVVIDTPDDSGPPQLYQVKESSCVADRLRVGDKIVAVDEQDVRAMTAIKVSKLIARRSNNASRKITIVRTTPID